MSPFFLSSLLIFVLLYSSPIWTYELRSCCSATNLTRLLSCPLNFHIQLRSVIFHMGDGCATSRCQKRLNKHYLLCNHHRTCSISIECIHMDGSSCPWLNNERNQSEYLTVEYDCQLYQTTIDEKKKEAPIVLFSAHVNIESPAEIFNESVPIDDNEQEEQWRDYLWTKFLHEKEMKSLQGENSSKSLFRDVARTAIILLIFAVTLIVLMLICLFIYKRCQAIRKRRASYSPQKHRPFPTTDDAYDNFKSSPVQSTAESGTATDV